MHSGIPATPELIQDLTLALREGESTVETQLSERVFSKEKKLLDPIPRSKRLNFETISIVKIPSKSLTRTKVEQAGLAAAVEFAEGVLDLSLAQILKFRLTEECL